MRWLTLNLLPWQRRALLAIVVLLCFGALVFIGSRNYLLFHSLVELFSIVVGCAVFTVVWNARRLIKDDYLLFVGIGFLFVAAVDLIHTLSYRGMNIVTESTDPATQLWIQARFLEAGTFCLAAFFVSRRIHAGILFGSYGLVVALGFITVFWWPVFPHCYIDGQGLTMFKRVSELVIIGLFGLGAALISRRRDEFDRPVLRLILASIGVAIVAELCFILYFSPTGYVNMAGHFLKLVSVAMIYQVFVVTGLRQPLNMLFRDLKKSEIDLRRKHDWLEAKVAVRTVELNQSVIALEQRTAQLRKLAADLIQAEQRERRRLSQLLHDHLQQVLVAARIHLGIASDRVDDEITKSTLAKVDEMLNDAISESRSLSSELSPRILFDAGLGAALTWLGSQMEEKHALKVDVEIEPGIQPGDDNISMMLFHSARELLFNVVKHAKAPNARVTLAHYRDSTLRLTIEDSGRGFDPKAIKESTGLVSIRERMSYLGGSMEIHASPGNGTRVDLFSPLQLPTAPHELR